MGTWNSSFLQELTCFFCHELDAVAQAEWRLLPVLNQLGDEMAYRWFALLHIPLFALLMWWTGNTSPRIRIRAQVSVDVFLVVHAGLHILFLEHPDNAFTQRTGS